MIETNIWFWVGFVGFVLAMLSLDLGVFHRTTARGSPQGSGDLDGRLGRAGARVRRPASSAIYGHEVSLTFLTGYVIEESLSIDNIFVIVLIFEYFRVPKICQHRVLFYGILGALVMRGVFIGLGAVLIAKFHWILYIFGAMLVITGVRMAVKRRRGVRRRGESRRAPGPPLHSDDARAIDGKHFFAVENGRRVATPLLLVLVLVEFTDLIFAVDSIPAIFGVTTDPFLVFTSNIFAILGLRSLYFLLAAVVDRFYLLKYGAGR